MTNITFYKNNEKITKMEVKGHTGKDVQGKDVLCSAISSVSQNAAVGIVEVLKLDAELKISDGYLSLKLKKEDVDNEMAQVILKTCLISLKEIVKNEKKYVKLEEKNEI